MRSSSLGSAFLDSDTATSSGSSASALKALTRALNDVDARVRVAAASALGMTGQRERQSVHLTQSEYSITHLRHALRDKNHKVSIY